jgi:hypothetical protein
MVICFPTNGLSTSTTFFPWPSLLRYALVGTIPTSSRAVNQTLSSAHAARNARRRRGQRSDIAHGRLGSFAHEQRLATEHIRPQRWKERGSCERTTPCRTSSRLVTHGLPKRRKLNTGECIAPCTFFRYSIVAVKVFWHLKIHNPALANFP